MRFTDLFQNLYCFVVPAPECSSMRLFPFPSSHLSLRFLEGSAEVVCFVFRLVSLWTTSRESARSNERKRDKTNVSIADTDVHRTQSSKLMHKSSSTPESTHTGVRDRAFFSSCSQHAPCKRSSQNRAQSGPRSLRSQLTCHKHCKDTCAHTGEAQTWSKEVHRSTV